jgi:hypothetical protein
LEKIMEFIAQGGLQKAREAELGRLKTEEQIAKIRASTGTGAQLSGTGSWGNLEGPHNDLSLLEVVSWIGELFRKA